MLNLTAAIPSPANADICLADFVTHRYLPFAQENKRSWKADKNHLEHYILPHLGAYPISEISTEILENWLRTLELTGFSYGSRFRFFWLIKYVLNCAVHWGFLVSNSKFKSANMPPRPGRIPELLSTEEALRLVQIIDEHRKWPAAHAIHLMLLTGGSVSEILNARWDDLDLEKGVLATNKTFTGRTRLIPLNNEALKLIQKLPRRDEVPWLFFTRTGNKLTVIWREWEIIRRELGRPTLRLQDLRHSFASFLISIGINQSELRNIMGHYKSSTLALVREETAKAVGKKRRRK